MNLFDRKVFRYIFAIVLALWLFAASVVIARYDAFSVESLLLSVSLGLCSSVVLAALLACYRYPKLWLVASLRSIMRRVAKKAIRLSLSSAMVPVECTGILDIDDEVALQIRVGTSNGITNGQQFNVYESTNNELWGRVVAINVRPFDCDCVPTDRVNIKFWQELERRMRYNTSKPPNVHLVRDLPVTYLTEQVENLLDNWR